MSQDVMVSVRDVCAAMGVEYTGSIADCLKQVYELSLRKKAPAPSPVTTDPKCSVCGHLASDHADIGTGCFHSIHLTECSCHKSGIQIRLQDAEERASKWAQLAMDMISELRQDYAPGALPELDGPKAVRKLRQQIERYAGDR